MLLTGLTEILQFRGAVDHLDGGEFVAVEQCRGGAVEQADVGLAEANQLVREFVELGMEDSAHAMTVVPVR